MNKANTQFQEKSVNFCKRCQTPFVRQQGSGDYEHTCSAESEVLQNEDVLVIGQWTDYTGSDLNVQRRNLSSVANTMQGTRGGIEGGKNENRTSRGYPTSRYRSRQHLEFIDVKEFKHAESSTSDPETYEDKNV